MTCVCPKGKISKTLQDYPCQVLPLYFFNKTTMQYISQKFLPKHTDCTLAKPPADILINNRSLFKDFLHHCNYFSLLKTPPWMSCLFVCLELTCSSILMTTISFSTFRQARKMVSSSTCIIKKTAKKISPGYKINISKRQVKSITALKFGLL